jgi:signal peptidase I
MGPHRARIAAYIAAAAIIAGLWINFAPTKLGGSTTYAITDGISMQPMLHAGDLAIVKVQPSYRVGEVVLYQSQVLHRPVLHRIILIQDGNYFFKGDHNGFVDPGYATRSELIGELWFYVPWIGKPLIWFAKPINAGVLAGGAALLFVLVSHRSPTNDRRKRRRSSVRVPRM